MDSHTLIGLLKGGIVIVVAVFGYTLGKDVAHKVISGSTAPTA